MSQDSGGDQRQVRIAKLDRLREAGINPYPDRFERTHTLAEARELPPDTPGVAICGRIMAMRVMGKLSFATLQDQSGRCQIWVRVDDVGADFYKGAWKKLFDIGDFVGVRGTTTVTRTGEPTVAAEEVIFLGKALRPLPEKWHGLTDQETRYRQRYLDLIMNQETRERFRFRSRVIAVIRGFLEDHDFEEVETPILSDKAVGRRGAALPVTQHNALRRRGLPAHRSRDLPQAPDRRRLRPGLRVRPLLPQRGHGSLAPPGLHHARVLRGILELRGQHALHREAGPASPAERPWALSRSSWRGHKVDFSGSWPRVDPARAPAPRLRHRHRRGRRRRRPAPCDGRRGHRASPTWTSRRSGFGKPRRPALQEGQSPDASSGPIFVTERPDRALSRSRAATTRAPRSPTASSCVVDGWEIVNAYSELVDPLDQRRRLEEQAALRAAATPRRWRWTRTTWSRMEYGMPPISGWGMGIDRLVCLLTNQENLRDVVLFPLMKRVEADGAEAPDES